MPSLSVYSRTLSALTDTCVVVYPGRCPGLEFINAVGVGRRERLGVLEL